MRNIPFAFLNEKTIDQINKADRKRVNPLAHLGETQRSMRGMLMWPENAPSSGTVAAIKRSAKRLVAMLEKMMEMSGPNSIANLERALRGPDQTTRRRVN